MNNITWFIYLIDVFSTLDKAVSFLALMGMIASVMALFVSMIVPTNHSDYGLAKTTAKRTIVATIIFGLLAVLTPSTQTMYLMLGSEATEDILQSETGKKVYDAINKRLDDYLDLPDDRGDRR